MNEVVLEHCKLGCYYALCENLHNKLSEEAAMSSLELSYNAEEGSQ